MVFCEIIPKSIPVMKHACNADFRAYKNFFPNYYSHNILEFCITQEGRMVRSFSNGVTEIIPPGSLISILKDDVFDSYAFQSERQRHISVGVSMEYDIMRWDSKQDIDRVAIKRRVSEKGHILIPHNTPLGESLDELVHMMQKLVYTYASGNAAYQTQALGEWFCICSHLTNIVLKELGAISTTYSPAAERYVQRASTYIQSYYTQKLTLENVAAHTGISTGHLSRVFREVKGISVLDYINQYRISSLMKIAAIHKYSLKEAAYAVGFDDPSYVSRLFKKTTGMTYRQFLVQCNEKEETNYIS